MLRFLRKQVRREVIWILLGILAFFSGEGWAQTPAAPPPTAQKERAEFEKLVAEWKPMLQQLFSMRIEYHQFNTPEARKEQLRGEYTQLMEQAAKRNQQIIDQAILTFLKDEYNNRDLEAFLMSALRYFMAFDMYEDAASMSQYLLNQKVRNNEIIKIAAMAAIFSNDFDTASMLGDTMKELGLINDFDWSRSDFSRLDYWKKQWQREKALRERERMTGDLPRVILETTKGEIEIELFENEAPNTVANFLFLVEKGFYTNLDFHRVVRGFVAQGGGTELLATETNLDGTLKKRGNGGPGYSIPDELGENSRRHFRGSVSMANKGPNTGGSQFFILYRPKQELDGRHTVFGRVVRGMNAVCNFLPRDPDFVPEDGDGTPSLREVPGIEMPDKILSARVVKKRNHPYSPTHILPDPGQKPPFPKMPGMEDKPSADLRDDNWNAVEFMKQHLP